MVNALDIDNCLRDQQLGNRGCYRTFNGTPDKPTRPEATQIDVYEECPDSYLPVFYWENLGRITLRGEICFISYRANKYESMLHVGKLITKELGVECIMLGQELL